MVGDVKYFKCLANLKINFCPFNDHLYIIFTFEKISPPHQCWLSSVGHHVAELHVRFINFKKPQPGKPGFLFMKSIQRLPSTCLYYHHKFITMITIFRGSPCANVCVLYFSFHFVEHACVRLLESTVVSSWPWRSVLLKDGRKRTHRMTTFIWPVFLPV